VASNEGGNAQDLAMASRMYSEKNTGATTGLNLAWDVSEKFSAALDISKSSAENTPNNNIASAANIQAAAFIRTSNSADFSGEIPGLIIGGSQNLKPSDLQVVGSWFQNSESQSDVDQYRLSGHYEFSEEHSVDFGAQNVKVHNHASFVAVQRDDWGGVGSKGDLASVYQGTDHSIVDQFNGSFGDFAKASELPGGNKLADGTTLTAANQINNFYAPNFFVLRNAAEAKYNYQTQIDKRIVDGLAVGDCGNGASLFCASHQYERGTDVIVDEETQAFFLQQNFQSEIASLPFSLHMGMRYESTTVESSSATPTYTGATWIGDTEIINKGGPITYGFQTGKYNYFLPNFDVSLDVREDVKVRLSASKSIGRPTFNDLQGGKNVAQGANQTGGTGRTGNPSLKPLESNNFDVSTEWYFAESSYVSLGYFNKKISNYVTTTPIDQSLFGVRNPAKGTYVDQAIAAIGSKDAGQIRKWIGENLVGQPGVVAHESGLPNRVQITAVDGVNPLMDFAITTPVNGDEERSLHGFEGAVQYMFGETGFGTSVNFTTVVSDLTFDDTSLQDQQSLLGLSDTYNLVGFYERDGISARLAYNWRDEFLNSRTNQRGVGPTYTEAYGQFDLSLSYDVMDNVQVFVQGINITDQPIRQHVRDRDAVLNYIESGARWVIGGTYNF
jgi:TonB-dependent receptor